MKFLRKDKTKDMLIKILDTALEISGNLLEISFTTRPGRLLYNPFYKEMQMEKERLHFEYLKRKGLLREYSTPSAENVIYCMTSNGTCLAVLEKMRVIVKGPLKWDGRWRGIVFDIPEKKRVVRDFLRRYLHELGCYQLQKSIWITPYNITKYLKVYIQNAKLSKWVNIIEINDIYPHNESLKKKFSIK